jgi:hypothetical protein
MTEARPEGAPPSAPPRLLTSVLQTLSGMALGALAFITAGFDEVFQKLEMRELPLPTEAFLALSRFIRWPVGSALFVLLELGLVALIVRGTLDRILKKLIVANGLFLTLLVPFYVLSIFLPIIRIQQALDKN